MKSGGDKACVAIYTINFFLYTAYSNLAPFYPQHAKEKGVSQTIIGVIFSASPVGSFLLSFFFGKHMVKIGRKRLMAIGIVLEAIAVISFGFIDFITNREVFIGISYVTRLVQGIGLSGFGSAAYAYVAANYPEQVMEKIAMIELFGGLGLMAGPLFGAGVYAVGGYTCVFVSLGVLFFGLVPYLWKYLPADKPYVARESTISYVSLLSIKRLVLAFLVPVFTIAGVASVEPTLQIHLLGYGLSEEVAAACFIIGTVSYSMVMPVVNKFPAHWDRRVITIIGMIFATSCQFFMGPTPYLFPRKLWITILGLFLQGYGCAITLIPVMPEMIKAAEKHYPDNREEISDRTSGLLSASFALGNLIGPQIGGSLADHYGFPIGATVIGLATLGYTLVLLTYGGSFMAFKSCWKQPSQEDIYVEAPETPLAGKIAKDEGGIEFQDTEAFSRKSTYTSISAETAN